MSSKFGVLLIALTLLLGVFLYNGRYLWYRLNAELGDAKAQVNLGIMYHYGSGVTKNHNQAANWYRLANEQGFDLEQRDRGISHTDGDILVLYRQRQSDSYLYCDYFSGYSVIEATYHYSPNNFLGKSKCPFIRE